MRHRSRSSPWASRSRPAADKKTSTRHKEARPRRRTRQPRSTIWGIFEAAETYKQAFHPPCRVTSLQRRMHVRARGPSCGNRTEVLVRTAQAKSTRLPKEPDLCTGADASARGSERQRRYFELYGSMSGHDGVRIYRGDRRPERTGRRERDSTHSTTRGAPAGAALEFSTSRRRRPASHRSAAPNLSLSDRQVWLYDRTDAGAIASSSADRRHPRIVLDRLRGRESC